MMDEKALQQAVVAISSRKYYCSFCGDRLTEAKKAGTHGPARFLCAIVEHPGAICKAAAWMVDTAATALANARLSKTP